MTVSLLPSGVAPCRQTNDRSVERCLARERRIDIHHLAAADRGDRAVAEHPNFAHLLVLEQRFDGAEPQELALRVPNRLVDVHGGGQLPFLA